VGLVEEEDGGSEIMEMEEGKDGGRVGEEVVASGVWLAGGGRQRGRLATDGVGVAGCVERGMRLCEREIEDRGRNF